MKSLYDSLDNDEGRRLLTSLAELWNYFFTEILPTLRAIFYPVQTKGLTMYQLSLLGFRDHVVLQLPLAKALSSCNESEIPPEITQMLLNLHAVHDGGSYATTPSEEYAQLLLLAKVVCPFPGSKGLSPYGWVKNPGPPLPVTPIPKDKLASSSWNHGQRHFSQGPAEVSLVGQNAARTGLIVTSAATTDVQSPIWKVTAIHCPDAVHDPEVHIRLESPLKKMPTKGAPRWSKSSRHR
nr:proline-rich protein 5-like [Lytechinus pictus]